MYAGGLLASKLPPSHHIGFLPALPESPQKRGHVDERRNFGRVPYRLRQPEGRRCGQEQARRGGERRTRAAAAAREETSSPKAARSFSDAARESLDYRTIV